VRVWPSDWCPVNDVLATDKRAAMTATMVVTIVCNRRLQSSSPYTIPAPRGVHPRGGLPYQYQLRPLHHRSPVTLRPSHSLASTPQLTYIRRVKSEASTPGSPPELLTFTCRVAQWFRASQNQAEFARQPRSSESRVRFTGEGFRDSVFCIFVLREVVGEGRMNCFKVRLYCLLVLTGLVASFCSVA
jgi:hypothetical protein